MGPGSPGPTSMPMAEQASWGFEEGQEIAPAVFALRLLGGGYKYEAYLAWDERLMATVVAKVLRPDQVKDASGLRTMEAERRMLNRLNHPCLPRCFGGAASGERPHVLIEFVEGPRLSTLLRKYGSLPVEQLLPLGQQLCSALHYMHASAVVHLDVKPKNIIMAAPPRLIDLSVARRAESAKNARHPIGTDAYMAPEQCEPGARGVMGPPSDVWGVGVTLYEALADHLPFPDRDGVQYPQLDAEPLPLAKDVPPILSEPILACLRPDLAERPTAGELAVMLEPLLEALPKRVILGKLKPRLR